MARTNEEIKKINEQFAESISALAIALGKPTGCVVCRDPRRDEIHKDILHNVLRDGNIATKFGFDRPSIIHHKFTCLPKHGGVTWTALERYEKQRKALFPVNAKKHQQKLYVLKELLFLRDEALKRNPIDRRELLKLAKEIDKAGEDYRSAKEEYWKTKREKAKPKEDDLDLSPEQQREMRQVQ